MISAFQKMIETSKVATIEAIGNLECNECGEDACNSEKYMTVPNYSTSKLTTIHTTTAITTTPKNVIGK